MAVQRGDMEKGVEEAQLKSCLKQLYVMKCTSSNQLLTSLHALEPLLSKPPAPRLLVVDSLSSHYWIDRSNGGDGLHAADHLQAKLMTAIQDLHQKYGLSIIATVTTSSHNKTQDGKGKDPECTMDVPTSIRNSLLPKTWQNLLTNRFNFTRSESADNMYQVSASTANGDKHELTFRIIDNGLEFCNS